MYLMLAVSKSKVWSYLIISSASLRDAIQWVRSYWSEVRVCCFVCVPINVRWRKRVLSVAHTRFRDSEVFGGSTKVP